MIILKSSSYKKDIRKKILNKHLEKENETVIKVEELLLQSETMKDVLLNPLAKIYNIEKKKGDLKQIYTARINSKLRLYMKPVGNYPYEMEKIVEIELLEIDDKHYGEG